MYGNTHTAHALRRARLEMFTMTAGDRPGKISTVPFFFYFLLLNLVLYALKRQACL